jgi:hypothetical protein
LRVLSEERPDLALQQILLSNALVEQGTPVTAMVTVRNQGLAAAPPSVLAIFAGDPNGGGAQLGTAAVPALDVGASFTQAFSIETAGLSGTIVLFAVADPGSLVAEYAETNNRRLATLIVRPLGSPPPASDNQPPIITNLAPRSAISGGVYTHVIATIDPEGQARRLPGPAHGHTWCGPGGERGAGLPDHRWPRDARSRGGAGSPPSAGRRRSCLRS